MAMAGLPRVPARRDTLVAIQARGSAVVTMVVAAVTVPTRGPAVRNPTR